MANTKTSKTAGETRTDSAPSSPDSAPIIAVNGQEPDVSDPQAEPEAAAQETPTMAELNGIRYKGLADRRIIRRSDLVALGVESPKDSSDLVWERANGFVVQTSQINAETRDALLALKDFVAV